MKLYYSPGACSLSPHIIINETQLPATFIKVDLAQKKTESGDNYRSVTAKGQVPALVLDDDTLLTEGPVIVQYLAEQANNTDLLPEAGTLERYRVMELLNYLTSEVHKTFGILFAPDAGDEVKAFARERAKAKVQQISQDVLGDKPFLSGDDFRVCDAYCFTILNWTNFLDIELPDNLKAYQARVAARPAVQKTLQEEGLIK